MNVSLLLLLVVIAMGAGLALSLVRRSRETAPLPDSKTLEAEIARLERYRSFRQPDCESGAERRRLMRRQLIELRCDFLRFWRVCRLLAPYSQDPDFGVLLITQFAVFHRLWLPLLIGTYGWTFEHAIDNFTTLVDSVKLLCNSAHGTVVEVERTAFESVNA